MMHVHGTPEPHDGVGPTPYHSRMPPFKEGLQRSGYTPRWERSGSRCPLISATHKGTKRPGTTQLAPCPYIIDHSVG